jgi:hypothetical protein
MDDDTMYVSQTTTYEDVRDFFDNYHWTTKTITGVKKVLEYLKLNNDTSIYKIFVKDGHLSITKA